MNGVVGDTSVRVGAGVRVGEGVNRKSGRALCGLVGPALVLACLSSFGQSGLSVLMLRYEEVGDIDSAPRLRDPSGIVYHPLRKTLFAVGDKGHVAELTTAGRKLRQKRVRKADFEGITVDPGTGLLYIAWEGPERILEMDPETLTVRRQFELERQFEGETIFTPGDNFGLESIAFVPDSNDPDGGVFFVSNQSHGPKAVRGPSVLVEVRLPLRANADNRLKGRIVRVHRLHERDLSACCYDAANDRLLVASDSKNLLLAVDRQGRVLARAILPGVDQEGLALDGQGFLYVAQDSGGIIKMKFLGFPE